MGRHPWLSLSLGIPHQSDYRPVGNCRRQYARGYSAGGLLHRSESTQQPRTLLSKRLALGALVAASASRVKFAGRFASYSNRNRCPDWDPECATPSRSQSSERKSWLSARSDGLTLAREGRTPGGFLTGVLRPLGPRFCCFTRPNAHFRLRKHASFVSLRLLF
jgi:hypothetical protein